MVQLPELPALLISSICTSARILTKHSGSCSHTTPSNVIVQHENGLFIEEVPAIPSPPTVQNLDDRESKIPELLTNLFDETVFTCLHQSDIMKYQRILPACPDHKPITIDSTTYGVFGYRDSILHQAFITISYQKLSLVQS